MVKVTRVKVNSEGRRQKYVYHGIVAASKKLKRSRQHIKAVLDGKWKSQYISDNIEIKEAA